MNAVVLRGLCRVAKFVVRHPHIMRSINVTAGRALVFIQCVVTENGSQWPIIGVIHPDAVAGVVVNDIIQTEVSTEKANVSFTTGISELNAAKEAVEAIKDEIKCQNVERLKAKGRADVT